MATEKTEVTEKDLKPATVDLAKTLRKEIKIDAQGVGTVTEDLFIKSLPEEITVEHIKALQKHTTEFVAAATLAFGEESNAVLKKNASLPKTSLVIPTVGRDTINIQVDRRKEASNPANRDEKIVTYGSASVSIKTTAEKGSSGELSRVRKVLAAKAKAAFGDK